MSAPPASEYVAGVGALPGPEAFSGDQPFVIRGLVKDWPALSRWSDVSYLHSLEGNSGVDVACSDTRVFRGDVAHHCVMPTSFSQFLDGYAATLGGQAPPAGQPGHMYLCQCPIWRKDHVGTGGGLLGLLRPDIEVPPVIQHCDIQSINLWMTGQPSRSNVHYDANHNLLCVVQGSKDVTLVPPREIQYLSAYSSCVGGGTSSNHCELNSVGPEVPGRLAARLSPGDCLFIPEGWYHQVDSGLGTVAVNFWWAGFDRGYGQNATMRPYYLRRLVHSMMQDGMDCSGPALNEATKNTFGVTTMAELRSKFRSQASVNPAAFTEFIVSMEPATVHLLTRFMEEADEQASTEEAEVNGLFYEWLFDLVNEMQSPAIQAAIHETSRGAADPAGASGGIVRLFLLKKEVHAEAVLRARLGTALGIHL